ncbi:enolase C-terminal domain-like protein [Pseudonocardia alni]|uniref:enolase C-terminal domain-like protein n=1 Tax=Pseudonocardia alni TaxID=33907 RepID=UPI0033D869A2
MPRITELDVIDLRFPTSREKDGSDAMNPDPDYSAAYVVLRTDAGDGLEGHGFTFTIGQGNEIVCAAIEALRHIVIDRDTAGLFGGMGAFYREVTSPNQMRWIGPEKGVVHLAAAAVLNAVWDLYAKVEGKPLWKLLADMTPEELVAVCDFRYVTDVLTPQEAVERLRARQAGKAEREREMREVGVPAYTTSAGWLGYDDEKIVALTREAIAGGWDHIKIKVGQDVEDDRRRLRVIRDEIGPDRKLMVDANQVWDVDEAIAYVEHLKEFDLWWVEEPTSPDDALGHAAVARAIAPIRVATGEQVQNRIIWKQLMQSDAIGFAQIDAGRLGGVNEAVLVMLLADKFGVPVCPHAGGVGLCELVQHLSILNYISITANLDDVVVEYIDHLHEHFLDPVVIRDGRYIAPRRPGYSAEIHADSLRRFRYPDGPEWAGEPAPALTVSGGE